MSAPRFVLALDQGTTSSRALLFDARGATVSLAQREFTQHYPRPGWVEHDPREIWSSQWECAVEALRQAGAEPGDVAGIGITNQRETTVVWERETGRPIAPAIVWQDRRTAEACRRHRAAGWEDELTARTGLRLDPYFSGTKLAWLLDHVDGARQRARRGELAFGTIDTWLVWHLSGGRHVIDASNASRTLLFDLKRGDWDDFLLERLDVPREVLPSVVDSSGVVAEVVLEGPLRGVPVAGIAGDQQAALFGQQCFDAGLSKNTYGTGCFLLLNTGDRVVPSRHGLLTTVAWRREGRLTYALEGSVFTAGAAVQWLRDGLGLIEASPDVERLAASVDDSGGIVLVPAFAGLGAPQWDPDARGLLIGLTRGTTAAHVARATLEAIALQCRDVLAAMEADSGRTIDELRVDGGASSNDLLMQLQADLLRTPVVRPRNIETTALGAASLAGLAVGFWADRDALKVNVEIERRFDPADGAEAWSAPLLERWRRAVERSRGWAVDGADGR